MQNALLSGDAREATLGRLMETYGTNVLRVCFLYLHDHALAQDASQTTFFKAWKSLDTLHSDGSEKAWLMAIAVNTCKSMLRSRQHRMLRQQVDLEHIPEPSQEAVTPDDTVRNAVMALPDKYRDVVVLHYYQSIPTPDVARILRIPQSTVRTRLRRARATLQSQLKGWYLHDE